MPQGEFTGDALEELARQYGKPGQPEYHNSLGMAYWSRGRLDAAIVEYREAIRLNPFNEKFHCNLGIALAQKGEHGEGLHEYEEALRLNPRDYHSHYSLGNLLLQLGRVDEAIAEYALAIEAAPERPEAHFNLADSLWDQNRVAEAAAHYEKALAGELEAQAAVRATFSRRGNCRRRGGVGESGATPARRGRTMSRRFLNQLLSCGRLPEHRLG
jgi:tetratricopeptide (TPR) repeat protein